MVFCTGSELYCSPILDEIESQKKFFAHRIYGNAVLFSNPNFPIKYYDFLLTGGRNKENTVIVENNVGSYLLNMLNGIPIDKFSNNMDGELVKLAKYLKDLNKFDNISDIIIESLRTSDIIKSAIDKKG